MRLELLVQFLSLSTHMEQVIIPEQELIDGVNALFDLRPAGIIHMLDLRRPIYRQTAAFGHFGRSDLDLPWERTDKAEALKKLIVK